MARKRQEIKIVLHAPQEKEDIAYLQNVHNEMITALLRKRLMESGATKKQKLEYLTVLAENIYVHE